METLPENAAERSIGAAALPGDAGMGVHCGHLIPAEVRSLRRRVVWLRRSVWTLVSLLILSEFIDVMLGPWAFTNWWGAGLGLAILAVTLNWVSLRLATDAALYRRRVAGEVFVCASCLWVGDPEFDHSCWGCETPINTLSPSFPRGDQPPVWCRSCERSGIILPDVPLTVTAKCRHCGACRDIELPLAAVSVLGVLSAQQFEACSRALGRSDPHPEHARQFQVTGGGGEVCVVNLGHPDDAEQPFHPEHAVSACLALWLDLEDLSLLHVGQALDCMDRRLRDRYRLRNMPVLVRQEEIPEDLQRLLTTRCGALHCGVSASEALVHISDDLATP